MNQIKKEKIGMKQSHAVLMAVSLNVVALMFVTTAHAASLEFPVPFFDNITAPSGIYTDGNGGKWGGVQ